jgi:hypothetical protein
MGIRFSTAAFSAIPARGCAAEAMNQKDGHRERGNDMEFCREGPKRTQSLDH